VLVLGAIAWGDVAGWVSGIATAGALVFAGWQIRELRKQASRDRRIELEGVVVSWRAAVAPQQAEPDGMADWVYEFRVHNPGRLPITNVQVEITFPVAVRRRHYTGLLAPSSRTIVLNTPVIAAQDERKWKRRLEIEFAAEGELRKTMARVAFDDLDGRHHTNVWPRSVPPPD